MERRPYTSPLTADEIYSTADLIELAMETKPVGYGWTPSGLAKRINHLNINVIRETLQWMVANIYITSDDRGAWTHYYRKY